MAVEDAEDIRAIGKLLHYVCILLRAAPALHRAYAKGPAVSRLATLRLLVGVWRREVRPHGLPARPRSRDGPLRGDGGVICPLPSASLEDF